MINNQNQLPYYLGLRYFEQQKSIPHRKDIYSSGPPSPIVSQETLGLIKKHTKKNVLDIGCGIGAYINELTKLGYKCSGIEINPEYVNKCKDQNLDVTLMSSEKLQFNDNSFDTVTMIEVLEHIQNPEKALSEAFRVAKNNVIISVPNIDIIPIMSQYLVVPWHLLEATHINFFTPKILENLLSKYTSNIYIQTYGHFAPWIEEQKIHMHIFGIGWKS